MAESARDEPVVLLRADSVAMTAEQRRAAVEALAALLDFAARSRAGRSVLEGDREGDVSLWGGRGEPAPAA